MKKATFIQEVFDTMFDDEKLSGNQMNYLRGGDGDGSEPGTDPWDPQQGGG